MSQIDLFHETLQEPKEFVENEFIKAYPTTENRELAERYGVTISTISRWAKELGVQKDRDHWKEQQRQRMLGVKRSKETCAKIAKKAKGRVVSEETKAKIVNTRRERGNDRKGETHYKWKGGRTWERFKDPEYIAWRNSVLKRDGYICQDCSRQCRRYEKGLAAHHIKPYATHPELRLEISNGVTLCRKCHMIRHGRALAPKEFIPCGCGCGTMIPPVDIYGRPRRYVNFHGSPRGTTQHMSKLTEDDVKAIRTDNRKQKEIAADYGIDRSYVSIIKSGKIWKHIT